MNQTIHERLRALASDETPKTQCRDSRLAVRKDYRGGRRGARCYDGGKKIRGRKRHILVDTEGFILKIMVHSAKKVPDQDEL